MKAKNLSLSKGHIQIDYRKKSGMKKQESNPIPKCVNKSVFTVNDDP